MSQYTRDHDLYRSAQHPCAKQEPINYFSSFRMSFYNSFEMDQNSSAIPLKTIEGDSDRLESKTQGFCCC